MATSQPPLWVQVFQALLTLAVALLAIAVGVAQWRTSHQRAVLDLFERRMAIVDALSGVVSKVTASGSVSHQDAMEFAQTTRQVDFLFGPEVKRYVEDLYRAMSEHAVAETKYKHGQEAMDAVQRQHIAFIKIAAYFDEFPKLVKPYLKMHQKAPGTVARCCYVSHGSFSPRRFLIIFGRVNKYRKTISVMPRRSSSSLRG